MKDACAHTADEDRERRPLILDATFTPLHLVRLQSIPLQKSEIYGSVPFTVLMILQQSVVAERGREP